MNLIYLCSAFALLVSSVASHRFAFRPQDFSDAEIAIIELPPPDYYSKQKSDSNNVDTSAKSTETETSAQLRADDDENSKYRPVTLSFPIPGKISSGSLQSIIIPLPTNFDDKSGIIVIEDHRNGLGNGRFTDQRTLRAQIYNPNRVTRIQTQLPKVQLPKVQLPKSASNSNNKNQSHIITINRITEPLRAAQTPTTTPSSTRRAHQQMRTTVTDNIAQSSTISTIHFDDDISTIPLTDEIPVSTFSPDTVFRPNASLSRNNRKMKEPPKQIKSSRNNKQNLALIQANTASRRTKRPPLSTTPIVEIIEETQTPTIETTYRTTTQRPYVMQINFRRNTVPQSYKPQTTVKPVMSTTELSELSELEIEEILPLRNAKESLRNRNYTTTIIPVYTRKYKQMPASTTPLPIETEDENNNTQSQPRPPRAPQIPNNFGFLSSGRGFNLPNNVPGSPGTDYPIYEKVPITKFDCREQIYPGFYADLDVGCQVYHSCNGGNRGSKHTFLCPNGTIFSQEYLICDWWYNVKCDESPRYYPLNKEAFSAEPKKENLKKSTVSTVSNKQIKKNKQTTTEFVMRTVTTTDLP